LFSLSNFFYLHKTLPNTRIFPTNSVIDSMLTVGISVMYQIFMMNRLVGTCRKDEMEINMDKSQVIRKSRRNEA
jgi:hypothetical protein